MIDYPTDPSEWQTWIATHLGYDFESALKLYEKHLFPQSELLDAWEREFDSSNGYSPDFVPALTRNIEGLLRWVYADGQEPNWKGSDADRCY